MPNGTNSGRELTDPEDIPVVLEWSVHPSARHPVKSALTVMVIAMVGGAIYRATATFLYSLIAVMILLITAAPFFFRTEFRLDETGVTARRFGRTRILEWHQIRTVTVSRASVYVSPHPPGSIHQRRGILVLCASNCKRVSRYIEKMRPADRP